MFWLIGIGILLVYALLVLYIGWSGWRWMKPWLKPRVVVRLKWMYIIAIAVVSSSFITGRLFGGITPLNVIGAYWMAAFSLLLLILPVVHLGLILSRLLRVPHHRSEKWGAALTLALVLSCMAYGTFNAYSPVVRTYDIHIAKDYPDLRELNVVMAADMHFSPLSGKSHAERMVQEINALQPDLVLFPGDIIDDDIKPYLDKGIDRILSGIEAKHGVYASLGNHDKYRGDMERLIGVLEQGSMQVLYDETAVIRDHLLLVGRKDRTERDRLPLSELMADADRTKTVILLDHQPYDFDIAAAQGVDVMVSGHTHRGQVAPAHLITQRMYENDWGHLQKGSFHSVVTSGFGFWGPPIRIGSRSEIVQIRLTFGS